MNELESALTNVGIAVAVVERKASGKTATDFLCWRSELFASDLGPDISFLLMGLEDFD